LALPRRAVPLRHAGPRGASCGRELAQPPVARLICTACAALCERASASGAELGAQRRQLCTQLGDLALELGDATLGLRVRQRGGRVLSWREAVLARGVARIVLRHVTHPI